MCCELRQFGNICPKLLGPCRQRLCLFWLFFSIPKTELTYKIITALFRGNFERQWYRKIFSVRTLDIFDGLFYVEKMARGSD